MVNITYKLPVNKEDFFKAYISVMNGILKLTPSEQSCLIELLRKDKSSRFRRGKRAKFSKELNKSEFNVNNLVSRLKKKGLIKEGEDGLELNSKLLDIVPTDGLELKFVLNINGLQ